MAKTKLDELRNMTSAELEQQIVSLKDELFKFRCERRAGRIEKPHRIKQARKKLARIYTILNEKSAAVPEGRQQ